MEVVGQVTLCHLQQTIFGYLHTRQVVPRSVLHARRKEETVRHPSIHYEPLNFPHDLPNREELKRVLGSSSRELQHTYLEQPLQDLHVLLFIEPHAGVYEQSGQLRDEAILQGSRLGTTKRTEVGSDKIADPETAALLRQRQEIRT